MPSCARTRHNRVACVELCRVKGYTHLTQLSRKTQYRDNTKPSKLLRTCYDGCTDPTAEAEPSSLVNASDSSEHCWSRDKNRPRTISFSHWHVRAV